MCTSSHSLAASLGGLEASHCAKRRLQTAFVCCGTWLHTDMQVVHSLGRCCHVLKNAASSCAEP